MKKHTPKFAPGNHYVEAHNAISSKEYGAAGFEDNGDIAGVGTIAQSQVQALLDQNLELTEPDEFGCRNFIMPYDDFEAVTEEYRRLKDEWIEENNVAIQPIF